MWLTNDVSLIVVFPYSTGCFGNTFEYDQRMSNAQISLHNFFGSACAVSTTCMWNTQA